MTTTTPTLPKHISDELRVILQKVHDDAVSPTHDSRLGYSERALEELATTLEIEVQKAVEVRDQEIAKQLEMTVLFAEKDGYDNESLGSKIRAFNRHFLNKSLSHKEST